MNIDTERGNWLVIRDVDTSEPRIFTGTEGELAKYLEGLHTEHGDNGWSVYPFDDTEHRRFIVKPACVTEVKRP